MPSYPSPFRWSKTTGAMIAGPPSPMTAFRSRVGSPARQHQSRPRGLFSSPSTSNHCRCGFSRSPRPARLTPTTPPPYWRPLLFAPPALPLDVSPPPIDEDPELKMAEGVALEYGTAKTFGDQNVAIDAAFNGVAIMDLSHFGCIRVTGEDRIQFLHNQSTANFGSLLEGEGCDTVFVTATARTIDIAYAWVMKNAILLLVSPSTSRSIVDMLNKYIFYADKVEVHDITQQTSFFALVGPKSNQVMETLNLGDLVGQPYGTHRHYSVGGAPLTIGVGSVMCRDGFSFMVSPASARSVWISLLSHGAIPMGTNAWERFRVLQGQVAEKYCFLCDLFGRSGSLGSFLRVNTSRRPAPGKELTKDYNVLEAGLSMAVSLDKGCYKGQETISRLVTYDGVKQRLWGIKLSGQAEPGSPIMLNGKKVGVLTSYSTGRGDGEHVGLGYIKRYVNPVEEVFIGDVIGTLVDVPFLSYSNL